MRGHAPGKACLVTCGLGAWLLVGCGAPPPVQAPAGAAAPAASVAGFPDDVTTLLKFRSVRFRLTIPLPDGRMWRIDDHSHRELVATHAPSHSTVIAYTFLEHELMSRQKCEARARELGLVPEGPSRTVEDIVTVGPDAYDTRVWVALEPGAKEGASLRGHVMAFGAFIHKCLFFRFTTEVPSDKDEEALSARLATARLRIFGGLDVEPFDEPPRDRPR